MDEAIHLLLVLDRYPLVDIETARLLETRRHLPSNLARRILGIKRRDDADAGFSINETTPDVLYANAEGTGDAHARHHHTPHHRRPFTLIRKQLLLLLLFDIVDRIFHGGDLLGGIFGNFNVEFLLESHHQFDRVKAVRALGRR